MPCHATWRAFSFPGRCHCVLICIDTANRSLQLSSKDEFVYIIYTSHVYGARVHSPRESRGRQDRRPSNRLPWAAVQYHLHVLQTYAPSL